MQHLVIKAHQRFFFPSFSELFEFRHLFFLLIWRDIQLRYKQTALGIAWVLLQPALTLFIFVAVFGKIMHVSTDGVPYLPFVLCGLVPWLAFSQAFQRATPSLVGDTKLITKVYFPRLLIPAAATCGTVIDFLICTIFLLVMSQICGISFSPRLLAFPLLSLELWIFCFGINFFFSALNVYYKDIKHMLPFLLQIWMYASPIAYPLTLIPQKYLFLYQLNPLVGIIESFRWACLSTGNFPLISFTYSNFFSLAIFFVGILVFQRVERNFTDIL